MDASESIVGYSALAAVMNFYFAICCGVFYFFKDEAIFQKRMTHVLVLQLTCTIALSNLYLLYYPQLPFGQDCPYVIFMWINYLCIPMWLFSYYLRSIHLSYSYKLALARTNGDFKSLRQHLTHVEHFLHICEMKFGSIKTPASPLPGDTDPKSEIITEGNISTRTLSILLLLIALFMLVVVIILHIVFQLDVSLAPFSEQTVKFQGLRNVFNFLYLLSGLSILCIPYFIKLIFNVRDGFYIKMELFILYLISGPTFLAFVILLFTLSTEAQKTFSPAFAIFIVLISSIGLSTLYPSYKLWKLKLTVSSLEMNSKSFDAVLHNAALFEEFKKVIASQFCTENALFIEKYMLLDTDIQNNALSPEQLQGRMHSIVTQFIQAGSPYELNVTSRCRTTIIKEFNGGKFDISLLKPAFVEVKNLLFTNSFPLYYVQQLENKKRRKSSASQGMI